MYQIVSQGEVSLLFCHFFYFYMQKMPYQLERVKQNIVKVCQVNVLVGHLHHLVTEMMYSSFHNRAFCNVMS